MIARLSESHPESCCLIKCRKLLQMSADRDMLRTVLLTEPAVQALGGFPVVHGKALVVHIRLFPRYCMEIQEPEIIRNRDILRTYFETVTAVRAGDGNRFSKFLCDPLREILFLLRERRKTLHEGSVIPELGQIAHPAQDDFYCAERSRKTNGEGRRRRSIGTCPVEFQKELGGGGREVRELPALDGLHDNHGFSVFDRCLVAAAGLGHRAIPVEIVYLQLDYVHFRMLRQDLIENICAVVKGKADEPGFSFFFQFAKEFEAAEFLHVDIAVPAEIVQKIDVEIVDSAAAELVFKVHGVVFRGSDAEDRHLVSQKKAVSGMAAYEAAADRLFGTFFVVGIGCIEIGEASVKEVIRHLTELADVDGGSILGISERETHGAESQLFRVLWYHGDLLCIQNSAVPMVFLIAYL